MTELTTSETLNRAADLIEKRGWDQGHGWFPEHGSRTPVCLEGALNALLGVRAKYECPAWLAVADYLSTAPDVQINSITGYPIVWAWNDRPGRTASEVIEVLRACAVIEASKEQAANRVSA